MQRRQKTNAKRSGIHYKWAKENKMQFNAKKFEQIVQGNTKTQKLRHMIHH